MDRLISTFWPKSNHIALSDNPCRIDTPLNGCGHTFGILFDGQVRWTRRKNLNTQTEIDDEQSFNCIEIHNFIGFQMTLSTAKMFRIATE